MKIAAYFTTLLVQFILIIALKLLDSAVLIYLIFTVGGIAGLTGLVIAKKLRIKQIAWGLLWGSITSIAITTCFLIWLSYNFPK